MALKALLYSGDDESPQHRSVLRAINTLNSPKIVSACSGGFCPSIWCIGVERKASCGALRGHFCRRRLWLAMVVLVDVGRWRRTSDRPTTEIVEIVYNFFYLFLRRSGAAKNWLSRKVDFSCQVISNIQKFDFTCVNIVYIWSYMILSMLYRIWVSQTNFCM